MKSNFAWFFRWEGAMRKILSVVVGATALSIAYIPNAFAADMGAPAPMYTKAPIAAPAYNWTGFYVGGEGGIRVAHSSWDATCFESGGGASCSAPPGFRGGSNSEDLNGSGPQLGGFIGYNWQFMGWGLLGLEGGIDWGHTKASLSGGFPGLGGPPGTSINDQGYVSTDWGGNIRARAGFFPMPDLLVYATGGIAFQQYTFNASCPSEGGAWCDNAHDDTVTSIRTGYTVGLGVEKAFGGPGRMMNSGPWHIRAEYRYSDFGNFSNNFFAGTTDVIGVSFPLRTQTVQLGISYKFGQ